MAHVADLRGGVKACRQRSNAELSAGTAVTFALILGAHSRTGRLMAEQGRKGPPARGCRTCDGLTTASPSVVRIRRKKAMASSLLAHSGWAAHMR
eukprot:scaffold158602_cov37-Tisochrysis_lutea.AAC.2